MKTTRRSDAALRIENLGKQYPNGKWGLRHATAHFEAGRMVAVLGPNGAGKSSLIHMLAGAITPTEGKVAVDSSLRIGWSSQRTTIDWYLNVQQNVEIGGRMYGLGRRECRSRARSLLEKFQLASMLTSDVSMLSGGQQQRIQVARTLMSEPDILLLDEPTASLDVESSEAVLEFLDDRTESGALVLVSSHDLGLLERYCDDVLFVLDGQIVEHQSMPQFLRRFNPGETITLILDSDLSPKVLDALKAYSPIPDPENSRAITVSLAKGGALSDVVVALDGIAKITDAHRTTASLRNVYLQVSSRKEVSK